MEKRVVKYQSKAITVPNGTTTAQIINNQIQLDAMYSRCVGVAVYSVTGTLTLSLGLTTQSGNVIQDLTIIDDYMVTTSVPQNERFKEVNFEARGNNVQYTIQPTVNLGADQTFYIIFLLEK